MPSDITAKLHTGDRAALARAITIAERGGNAASELLAKLNPANIRTIGVTGPPGVGKSTLIGALATHWADEGRKVAVLATDPTSPITGGSILADRTTIGTIADHPNVFVRSTASAGTLGGLGPATTEVKRLYAAAGYDILLVETVGEGQLGTAVSRHVDLTLLLAPAQPGLDLQAMKAGVLEVADVIAITKADLHPRDAQAAAATLRAAATLSSSKQAQILTVSAKGTRGVTELAELLRTMPTTSPTSNTPDPALLHAAGKLLLDACNHQIDALGTSETLEHLRGHIKAASPSD